MNERSRQKKHTGPFEHARARDLRYEAARLKDIDMTELCGTLDFSKADWDAYDPEKKATLTEFITNLYAGVYGERVPLAESDRHETENKERVLQAYDAVIEVIKNFVRLSKEVQRCERIKSPLLAEMQKMEDVAAEEGNQVFVAFSKLLNEQYSRHEGQYYYEQLVNAYNMFVQGVMSYGMLANSAPHFPEFVRLRASLDASITPFSHIETSINRRHDWVHYADEMADGEVPGFAVETDTLTQQLDDDMQKAELYPSLFLEVGYRPDDSLGNLIRSNLVMALRDPRFRKYVRERANKQYEGMSDKSSMNARATKEIAMLFYEIRPNTVTGRQAEYEKYLQCIQVQQALMRVPSISEDQLRHIYDIFENMRQDGSYPERYKAFAARVFSKEPEQDKNFFADELVALVEQATSHELRSTVPADAPAT